MCVMRVCVYSIFTLVWAYEMHACVCTCTIVCVQSGAEHPGQGEGLILCGLKRINFVLTLVGCGLHPYPPLFSLPGARQRRRQASGDGEDEEEGEGKRGGRSGEAEILRSVISEEAFILSSCLYLHFCELALLRELFKYVCCARSFEFVRKRMRV